MTSGAEHPHPWIESVCPAETGPHPGGAEPARHAGGGIAEGP